MQTRTNMFLVNLAIADFCVGILLAPFSLTTLIMDKWIFGEAMCQFNGFMNAVCFITSFQTLMYISIHKYISITRPFSRVLNHRKILIMISAAWIWAIICAILTMFILSKVIYKVGATQCGPAYPQTELAYIHTSFISISNIFIPLVIMVWTYGSMYYVFRQHALRLHNNTTLQSDQILAQQLQITKTLFIVLACFMMCILPYFSYTVFVSLVKDKTKIPTWANPVAYCFMYMNSGCNPIIYAWRSPSFRQGYKQILCQNNGNIVSDETIHDTDSPSLIRRFSVLLQSSFRSSRLPAYRNSEESSSVSSAHTSRPASVSSPSHTLLKRAMSKTARGSSIIRSDGSVIITKNGKIISVRRDMDCIKRQKTFNGFDEKFLSSRPQNGVSRSVSDKNITENKIRAELRPLLQFAYHTRGSSAPNGSVHSSNESCNLKLGHQSLTKIESLDEIDNDINTCRSKPVLPAVVKRSKSSASFSAFPFDADTMLLTSLETRDHSPSIKSDLDDVFVATPIIITSTDTSLYISSTDQTSQENMLNSMCLKPLFKSKNKIAKSDMQLDQTAEDTTSPLFDTKNKNISKSSHVVNKAPYLRCPSIERLDVGSIMPRCSSDAANIQKLIPNAPMFVCRWLSNKNVDKSTFQ